MFHIENNDGITLNEMGKIPAIFSENQDAKLSGKYSKISTIEIIQALEPQGWRPVWIGQCATRDADRLELSKHMVKFRNFREDLKVGDSEIEFLLKNSHNGQCSNQFMAGLIRFLCANEMVLADSVFPTIRLKHINTSMTEVLNAADRMLDGVKEVKASVEKLSNAEISPGLSHEFARQALQLRYQENAPIKPEKLLKINRQGDRGNDLWTVFNRVQENLVRGGIKYFANGTDKHGRPSTRLVKTREIKSIDQKVKINQELHSLALQFA